MALILKQNYRLEDLLFDQAAKLEKEGNAPEAASKLNDALNADTVQKKSLERIKQKIEDAGLGFCPEDFREEFQIASFNIHIKGLRYFPVIRYYQKPFRVRHRWDNN